MPKSLIDNVSIHEDFATIINEERNYLEIKKSIRMIKSQRSDIKRNKLIDDGKRIIIDEISRQNERINNNLKSQE